jgi:hypothetical protein
MGRPLVADAGPHDAPMLATGEASKVKAASIAWPPWCQRRSSVQLRARAVQPTSSWRRERALATTCRGRIPVSAIAA